MDEKAFQKFLKQGGRSQTVAGKVVRHVAEFERFLRENQDGRGLDEAAPEDLEAFISLAEEERKGAAKRYLHSIRYYYEYASNSEMRSLAGKLRQQRITQKPFPLQDFRGINPVHVRKLASMGIRNVEQMLDAGRTRRAREELSRKTGILEEAILELVKLSDLARIFGVKSIRARLYYDAGVDSVENMAKWDPQELRVMLIDFVKRTGFDGIAPLPKEAEFTVAESRRLPRIVEY